MDDREIAGLVMGTMFFVLLVYMLIKDPKGFKDDEDDRFHPGASY